MNRWWRWKRWWRWNGYYAVGILILATIYGFVVYMALTADPVTTTVTVTVQQ